MLLAAPARSPMLLQISDDFQLLLHWFLCRPKDHANFFATTKFFSCLDLAESQELLESSQMVSWRGVNM